MVCSWPGRLSDPARIEILTDSSCIQTPPTLAGLSFALHLLRVQGFYFALLQYSTIQAFTARFVSSIQLYRPHRKAAHRALQVLFRRLRPLNRPRYQTPRRTLYRPAQPPYYNKVYKSAAVRLLWIHARRCNIQQTMPARRGTTGGSCRSSFRAFAR